MARAFRLAARGNINEEVFNQEIGLIRTRQRWLAVQRERLGHQLADAGAMQVVVERLLHGANVVAAPVLGFLEVVADKLAGVLGVQRYRHGVLPRPRFLPWADMVGYILASF